LGVGVGLELLAVAIALPTPFHAGVVALKENLVLIVPVIVGALPGGSRKTDPPGRPTCTAEGIRRGNHDRRTPHGLQGVRLQRDRLLVHGAQVRRGGLSVRRPLRPPRGLPRLRHHAARAGRPLQGGLAVMLVQHVAPPGWHPTGGLGRIYGETAAEEAGRAGASLGCTLWCDLEEVEHGVDPRDVVAYCNNW
jgi:hypothetical protein